MAGLSTLSIGVLCGGSALFVVILVGFLVWKVRYDRSVTASKTRRNAGSSPQLHSSDVQQSLEPQMNIMSGRDSTSSTVSKTVYCDMEQNRENRESAIGGAESNRLPMASFSPSDSAQQHSTVNNSLAGVEVISQNDQQHKLERDLHSRLEPIAVDSAGNKETDSMPDRSQELQAYDNLPPHQLAQEVPTEPNAGMQNDSAQVYSLASPVTATVAVVPEPATDQDNEGKDDTAGDGTYFVLEREEEHVERDAERASD